ncbi:MAG: hypothetical protein M5T61_06095 [Acidimicrobiia bacterium]|nr:hypothetical protein [Acidimicrobiia bacterium]
MGVGETLDAAVAVYRRRFWPLLKLTALVVLPVQALQTVVLLSSTPDSLTRGMTGTLAPGYENPAEEIWVYLAATVSAAVLGLLATALATAATTKLVSDTYLDEPTGSRESLRYAGRRFAAIVGVSLATGILTVLGLFVFLIPGIWLMVSWSVVIPVLVVENVGVGKAMRRSFDLVKSRWWPMLGLLLTGQLLGSIIQAVLAAVLEIVVSPLGEGVTGSIAANGIAGGIGSVLTTPFVAAAFVIAYFDLRIRSEGFDVLVMIRHLDRVPAPSRP